MKKYRSKLRKVQLTLLFALTVFLIILASILLTAFLMIMLHGFKIIEISIPSRLPLFMFAVSSLIISIILSCAFSYKPLNPIIEIIKATDKIADGDFNVQLDLKGPDDIVELGEKFNHMAKELSSVEILRSDFVNNFSHEFKTPIVSIRGFAKMLKRDDLTFEERNEYLNIIIDESERLTKLSTNVLNLSKLEQQSIITNKTLLNVTEQIRLVIALLEDKWESKNIDINFNCREFYIMANEELLKQVWINLLDNAIKFSPDKSNIEIDINASEEELIIIFRNQCKYLSEETRKHLFDKFYQGDSSHSVKGNGLGLTIAKKILELHKGRITLIPSRNNDVIFNVIFPK